MNTKSFFRKVLLVILIMVMIGYPFYKIGYKYVIMFPQSEISTEILGDAYSLSYYNVTEKRDELMNIKKNIEIVIIMKSSRINL